MIFQNILKNKHAKTKNVEKHAFSFCVHNWFPFPTNIFNAEKCLHKYYQKKKEPNILTTHETKWLEIQSRV